MPGGGEAQGDDDDILGPLSDHFDAGTRCGYETSLGNSVMRVVGPSLDVAVPRPHVDSPPRHEAPPPILAGSRDNETSPHVFETAAVGVGAAPRWA